MNDCGEQLRAERDIAPWGIVVTTTVLRTRSGALDSQDRPTFDALKTRIAKGSPKILLHLHGGLVNEGFAVGMAGRLSGTGDRAYNAPADWEQVYIIWRTGALETLKERWKDLATNDRLYRTLLRRLLVHLSGEIALPPGLGRAAGRQALTAAHVEAQLQPGIEEPFAAFDQAVDSHPAATRSAGVSNDAEEDLMLALKQDTDLEDAANAIEAALTEQMPAAVRAGTLGDAATGRLSLARLDDRYKAEFKAAVEAEASTRGIVTGTVALKVIKLAFKIGINVLNRYRRGRDHGLHATVSEEIARLLYGDLIGSIVWGMMKGNAADHFGANGFGAELLQALAANPNARLVIVGHSAGSIFASDLLLWAGEKNIALKADLVFLAPAVRISKFAAALDAGENRIDRFRMYTMRDELERRDVLLGKNLAFVYPSSLLYLVSGLFEEEAAEGMCDAPLLGMQRFLDGENNWLGDMVEGPAIKRIRSFLAAASNRTVYSTVTGESGLSSNAISHGGFDDEAETLRSVRSFLD